MAVHSRFGFELWFQGVRVLLLQVLHLFRAVPLLWCGTGRDGVLAIAIATDIMREGTPGMGGGAKRGFTITKYSYTIKIKSNTWLLAEQIVCLLTDGEQELYRRIEN